MRTILLSLILAASLAAAHKPAQKKVIQPKDFPTGRPFSPGILVDGTLYVAGQTGSDVKTGKIPDEFEAEVKQALDNVGAVLKAGGMSPGDVVSVQVYLTDAEIFERMNAVYKAYFKEPRPTRTTVVVAKLVGQGHIEITATARKMSSSTKIRR